MLCTSGEISSWTGSCAPLQGDLSEVLLDFDLIEDLLELFGVLTIAAWDSESAAWSGWGVAFMNKDSKINNSDP